MATPAVSGDGTFYCVYPSYLVSQSVYARYLVAVSGDDGFTFDYHEVVKVAGAIEEYLAKKGYLLITDPSDVNHLLFCYPDAAFGDADVFITESYNKGITWTDPVRVNDDLQGNGILQDLVWAAFDNEGNLIVNWRDRRHSGGTGYETAYEIWGTYRKKDSTAFSVNFRISDTLINYDDVLSNSGNDFMCVKLRNDTLYSTWGDTRTGKLNIWFQRMKIPGEHVNSAQDLSSVHYNTVEIFPNPTARLLHLKGSNMKEITVLDTEGKIFLHLNAHPQKETLDISLLTNGVYFIRIKTKTGIISRKFIVEK